MAANKSSNKVRVTKLFGSDSTVGLMDPQVNMKARRGTDTRWVVGLDSGNAQVSLAMASGGAVIAKAYPHELVIDTPQASGFGWPASSDSVTLGHKGVFPNGVPAGLGSGIAYEGGDDAVHTFGR